ncbi:MAG: hypothetical protein ISS79_11610 [Phycisphaerae bacterium]|nr:hypothetical protein [Phycisphaerae bacterium]
MKGRHGSEGKATEVIASGQIRKALNKIGKLGGVLGPIILETAGCAFFNGLGG